MIREDFMRYSIPIIAAGRKALKLSVKVNNW